MYDLLIIGGGPAGIAAAVFGLRRRLRVLLLSEKLGGRTNSELSLPDAEHHQVVRGVSIVEKLWRELDFYPGSHQLERVTGLAQREGVFMARTDAGATIEARAVVLATGVRVEPLGIAGEKRFAGFGLSYSATSHAPLFVHKRVVVIGGDKRARRAVSEVGRLAAAVHWITPMAAANDTPMMRRLRHDPKVTLWEGSTALAIEGGRFAEAVTVRAADGSTQRIACDGVLIESPLRPNSELAAGLADRGAHGQIVIDPLNRTSCPGLFAAGDVTTVYAEQVLIALGEGAKAALSAFEYLLELEYVPGNTGAD